MENFQKSFLKSPSLKQKQIMLEQNQLALTKMQNSCHYPCPLVSRDKFGNIIVIAFEIDSPILVSATAYMLGKKKSGDLMFLPVGVIDIDFDYVLKNAYVAGLYVIERFKSFGVGSVLLKLAENLALDRNCTQLTLLSELNISKIKSHQTRSTKTPMAESGFKVLDYPTGKTKEKFNGYFDRNLYFYYSNGFEIQEDDFFGEFFIPLAKKSLSKTNLEFGVNRSNYLFNPNDPRFAISNKHLKSNNGKNENYHILSESMENDFDPFKLSATKKSLEELKSFIDDDKGRFKVLDTYAEYYSKEFDKNESEEKPQKNENLKKPQDFQGTEEPIQKN